MCVCVCVCVLFFFGSRASPKDTDASYDAMVKRLLCLGSAGMVMGRYLEDHGPIGQRNREP